MPLQLQMPELEPPRSWAEAAAFARTEREMEDALGYFRRFLGDGWKGWQRRFHLARSFHSRIQSDHREWVRLYRLCRALDGTPNVELLVKGLGGGTWREHIAAEQALEFCGRIHRAGRRIEIIRNTHNVSPDTRVWLRDRPVTVEFKALHDPDERAPWTAFEDDLARTLMHRPDWSPERFAFSVVFEPPALHHVAAVATALDQIVDERDEEWRDLPQGAGRARFVGAPDGDRRWWIPAAQQDDITRVMANLYSKWIKQLRTAEGPTLLVVLTRDMFFMPIERVPAEVERITTSLRAMLPQRRMLGGVLFHEEPFQPPYAPVRQQGDDWRFAMGATEGRARSVLLVQNSAARAPLTPSEIDPLVGPDMHW